MIPRTCSTICERLFLLATKVPEERRHRHDVLYKTRTVKKSFGQTKEKVENIFFTEAMSFCDVSLKTKISTTAFSITNCNF